MSNEKQNAEFISKSLDASNPSFLLKKKSFLRRAFKKSAAAVLIIHCFLFACALINLFIWWKEGHAFILLIRSVFMATRIACILAVLCYDIDVVLLVGVGKYYKIIRSFSRYTPLGIWLLVGFIDLYLIRFTAPFIDVLLFVIRGSLLGFQFVSYLILDIIYVSEFYLTLYLMYYVGVLKNVSLLFSKKKNKKKKKTADSI